jgi:hypothetical protein
MQIGSVNLRRESKMFDYSERIEKFREEKVRLSSAFLEDLLAHRNANRSRLKARLPDQIPGVTVSDSDFKPQGSVAVRAVIQTKFAEEEYDIDDGLVLEKDELVDERGNALTALDVKERVCAALQDDRFLKQPEVHHNCVRVFYSEEDEERHHVDFAIYRRFYVGEEKIRELAGAEGWTRSDPTQVNAWFDDIVKVRNQESDGWGTQFRHLIHLLKRFCRSRRAWDLPNGMKLTMLVAECQLNYADRIDEVFRDLLEKLDSRLTESKIIRNLAHPDQPALTRSGADQNVIDLHDRIKDGLERLETLDSPTTNNCNSARAVWDWIFQSEGYFDELDEERKKSEAKEAALREKAALIGAGARTSPTGVLGSIGMPNLPHRFYGDPTMDQT